MPRDFLFERLEDFLDEADRVEAPKYVAVEGLVVRAFFPGRWWLNVYEASARDESEARSLKERFVGKGFAPISIRESPIKVF